MNLQAQHTLIFIRTLQFAALKHANERRKDPEKTPYINHLIGVVNILAVEGGVLDIHVLQVRSSTFSNQSSERHPLFNIDLVIGVILKKEKTALLHDSVEDTNTSFEEIEEHFGRDIRNFVEEVTNDQTLSYYQRKDSEIYRATVISHEAKLVKLADKIHNLRDLLRVPPVGWSELRLQEYFMWAGKVTEGLLGTNKDLEEIVRELLARKGIVLSGEAPPLPIPISPPMNPEDNDDDTIENDSNKD